MVETEVKPANQPEPVVGVDLGVVLVSYSLAVGILQARRVLVAASLRRRWIYRKGRFIAMIVVWRFRAISMLR
jgi:hypothetical protein